MAKSPSLEKLDEALVRKVASLAPGTRRWLKTTLQTIRTSAPVREPNEKASPWEPVDEKKPRANPATLEDVIAGKADLREQLDAYPDLREELDGIADIVDLLREAGERRRKRGEQILREEILGEQPEKDQPGAR